MEVIRTVGSLMGSIKMLVDLIETNKMRHCTLKVDLNSVKADLRILCDLDKQLQLIPAMQLQLHELVYDIDDFIQGLCYPGKLGSFIPTLIGADNRPRLNVEVGYFKERIKNLKDELQKAGSNSILGGGTSTTARPSSSARPREVVLVGIEGPKKEIEELISSPAEPHLGRLRVISIVGCSGSGKTALARALYEDDAAAKDFDYKAWVVASDHSCEDIVTKIRQAVVPASAPEANSQASQDFISKILGLPRLLASARWSTTCEAFQDYLNKIFQLLRVAPASRSTAQVLQHFQNSKRYLIFLDDVQRGAPWEEINIAFRENIMDSRIIVTTSVPSVGRTCSPGSYMYTMQHLNKENSRRLFRVKFREKDGYSAEDEDGLKDIDIDIIIDKCDGLPVALIGAAKYLRLQGPDPTSKDFEQVSQELGDCLDGIETTFEEIRRAHVEPYNNLLNHGEKECLLYVSLFSHGHPTNSKSLVRRLITEGLVPRDADMTKSSKSVVGDVCKCLKKLMDHCMIEPVPIRNYYNAAKWCRVHSIMLEFAIKKAVSRNFVSIIQNEQYLHNAAAKVRRLTVQFSPDLESTGPPKGMGLSVARSVAIFGKKILNLEDCKLVRVLDLEGCNGLTQKDLDNICGLLFLKYLSLRNTSIQQLPRNVKKLQCLETLDTRNTVVIQLPVEVIMLPQFAYLFGQFELTNLKKNIKQFKFFFKGNKSQLHTLGTIAIQDTECLEIVAFVLQYARKLKKVKVWYKATSPPVAGGSSRWNWKSNSAGPSTDPSSNTPDPAPPTSGPVASGTTALIPRRLVESLEKPHTTLESLSIDFNGVPNNFLGFLGTIFTSTISSIKFRKGFGNLPGTLGLRNVSNLKKLHLFSTDLESNELAALQYLKCLQYLKLEQDGEGLWDSVFHVEVGGFISLIWMCFESSNSKHPPLKIDEGVKTPLNSLLLLCKESHPRVEGMSHLSKLNEVILHKWATDDEVNAWKGEAEKHINRPYVEKQQV